jgi:hypothetical protein
VSYQIIVRFPDKATADAWCGQMTDGAGEGFCEFTGHRQKPGTKGNKESDFERVTDSAPKGTPVFFMHRLFED